MREQIDLECLPAATPVELEPGVTVERRGFLSLAAFGAVALARPLGAGSAARATGSAWERFLEEAVPAARELLEPGAYREDRYLHAVASLASAIDDVPVPDMRPSGQGENTFLGGSYGPDPFVVLHWRMEPGSRIRTHAHTYGNVVTLGLEGMARVRNYEMLGERDFDAEGTFRVRMTQDQVLLPGRINLVPLEHGYMHGFEAGPEGARGIDITTRRKERRETPYLDVAEKPVDEAERIYEASWTD